MQSHNLTQLVMQIGLNLLEIGLKDPVSGRLPKPQEIDMDPRKREWLLLHFKRALTFRDMQGNEELLAHLLLMISLLDPHSKLAELHNVAERAACMETPLSVKRSMSNN